MSIEGSTGLAGGCPLCKDLSTMLPPALSCHIHDVKWSKQVWYPVRSILVSVASWPSWGLARLPLPSTSHHVLLYWAVKCLCVANLHSLLSASWHFYFQKAKIIISLQICSRRLLSHWNCFSCLHQLDTQKHYLKTYFSFVIHHLENKKNWGLILI